MAERLKQIWAGFEEATTRRLTGRGVDNIIVPHRTDWKAEDEMFLPENFNRPAQTAFDALHEKMAENQKKFGRNKQKTRAAEKDAEAGAASSLSGGEELVKGLRATAMRTERTELDYQAFLASDEGKAALKKRKTLFGMLSEATKRIRK